MKIAPALRSNILSMRFSNRLAVVACLTIVAGVGISNPSFASPRTLLAGKVLRQHIVPSYQKLVVRADGMVEALKVFCATPGGLAKGSVDTNFQTLVVAWAHVEHIRFGPVVRDNIYEKMYFWPDRKGIGRRQIDRAIKSGNPDVLDIKLLGKKSAALQGIGALEHLLYGPGAGTLTDGSERGSFRCLFARAVALNISDMATVKILKPWSENGEFATHFLKPGPGNPFYLTEFEVVTEIVKTYVDGLYYLRDVRLARPLGMKRGRKRKTRAAFEKSGHSLLALRANIEGLRDFFLSSGLADWIGALEPGLDKTVLVELNLAIAHAKSIHVTFEKAVSDPALKSKLISMGFPLKNARDLVRQTLARNTDLSLGINALDGD